MLIFKLPALWAKELDSIREGALFFYFQGQKLILPHNILQICVLKDGNFWKPSFNLSHLRKFFCLAQWRTKIDVRCSIWNNIIFRVDGKSLLFLILPFHRHRLRGSMQTHFESEARIERITNNISLWLNYISFISN